MIQSNDKITWETRKENQQLRILIEDQKQKIRKLQNRLLAIERFITSGAEISDMVEVNGPTPSARGAFEKFTTTQPLTQFDFTRFRDGSNEGNPFCCGLKRAALTYCPLRFTPCRGDSDDERDFDRRKHTTLPLYHSVVRFWCSYSIFG